MTTKTDSALPIVTGENDRVAQMGEAAGQKIFLPQHASQSRFTPPQYYYEASKSGAVPSWSVGSDRRRSSSSSQMS